MATYRYVAFSPALAWLAESTEALDVARQTTRRPGEAFADAVLGDPTRLVDLYRAAVVASLAPETPVGVTEELTDIYRRVAARAAKPSETRDALQPVVSSLRGLRDRDELVPALVSAAEKITDLPTRERILEFARFTSQEPTLKKRGRFGQVVVDVVIPTEPDPVVPDGTDRRTPKPDRGGEPTVPVIDDGSREVDLLDQVATSGAEAAADWADDAGFSTDDAAQWGAIYATKVALEIIYGSDIGESDLSDRCLLAEVLSRVGERLGGVSGHAFGWDVGMQACQSPTPHGVHSAIMDFGLAMQLQPRTELLTPSLVACVICDDCIPCVIADQMLRL